MIVIAGGTGKAGRRLAQKLGGRYAVRQLGSGTNLLSLGDAEVAMSGAQTGVYLARATRSYYRLLQARPADLELLMADSFGRAAARCGVKRIFVWRCGADDERVTVLAGCGVPLTVVDSAEEIEAAFAADPPDPEGSSALLAPQPAMGPGICSLQRLPLPAGWTAAKAASEYFGWAASHLPGVSASAVGEAWTLRALGVSVLSLSMIHGRMTPQSAVLRTGGGLLDGTGAGPGQFEFRIVQTNAGPALLTSLMGFVPSLPWFLYRWFQAPIHAWVMARFGKWLATQSAA